MILTLKIYKDDAEFVSKTLGEGVYRIGRSEFSDIVLPGEGVSRSHIEIRITENSAYFTNMSSPGRVKVNNKVIETGELSDGDLVYIGSYQIHIQYSKEGAENQNNEDAIAGGQDEEPNPADLPIDNSAEVIAEENDGGENIVNQEKSQPSTPLPEIEREASPSEGSVYLAKAETLIEMKPVVAKLLFIEGPRKAEELFLETYEITLGRSKKADVYLDDEKLSRKHAKITRVGMGYRLIDLNSRNGTYVNGVRVLEHPLSSFDQIELGSTKIKFLVQDLISNEAGKGSLITQEKGVVEQTKSLALEPINKEDIAILQGSHMGSPPSLEASQSSFDPAEEEDIDPKKLSKKSIQILVIVILLLFGFFFLIPSKKENSSPSQAPTANKATSNAAPTTVSSSKEYLELSSENQRSIEGHYTTAMRAADQENYEEAIANLKRIHEIIPYYKQSKELLEQYTRRLKERQIQEAAEKAKKDETQELKAYLEDGVEYLKQGEFDRAAEAFNSAITLDPNNTLAIKGLKAAEYKIRNVQDVPPDRDPEKEKIELVRKLFEQSIGAFSKKSYQEAIETAEEIRKIEIKGETEYLNEAKQIIDRSRMLQKEEFEPFLTEAKDKYAEGDYNAARDLAEEMLKRNPAYEEAKDLLVKTKKQLNRLAKEAYVRGYILESLSRLDEAKQYWKRAQNYVRPGDEYYDKVTKKLDQYQ